MSGAKEVGVVVGGAALLGEAVAGVVAVGAVVVGAAVLATLAIPAGVAMVGYAGKAVAKGTVAAGKQVYKTAKAYEEYRKEQELKKQRIIAERLAREMAELGRLASPYSQLVAQMKGVSLLKQHDFSQDSQLADLVKNSRFEKTLDKAIAVRQQVLRRMRFLQDLQVECGKAATNVGALQREMAQMAEIFRSQSSLPVKTWPAQLQQYQREAANVTLETLDALRTRWANWKLDVTSKLKSLEIQTQVLMEFEGLKNTMPCSAEESRALDPAGFAQLEKLEQHLRNQVGGVVVSSLPVILRDYRAALEQHKATIAVGLQKQKEENLRKKAVYRKYAPKVAELEQMLELANNELVQHWAAQTLTFLKDSIQLMEQHCHDGKDTVLEEEIASWRGTFEKMLTEAGLKQQAEERRQYIVQSMKAVLPEMGFRILSLQSGNASSDTVLKVAPDTNDPMQGRRRITISIPQAVNENVCYKFDGYPLKRSREKGQLIEENDDGKRIVQGITQALKPFGIMMTEPDWRGNPDKLQKGARDLPDFTPAEERGYQQTEQQQREMEW